MASTGTAYIAGFSPFADKGVVEGLSGTPKEAAFPAATAAAAKAGTVMAHNFICYYETMIFKAKPFAAFGAMDGMRPVYYAGN